MEKYFIIQNSDGDTHVDMVSKDILLKRLNEDYYGSDVHFLSKMPSNSDTNYWGDSILIIKGNIANPKAKQKIVEYDI